jgi:predicted ferric reductase
VLPGNRWSWLHKLLSSLRRHPAPVYKAQASIASVAEYGRDLTIHKVNQFGRGQPNFNAMALWLVTIPGLFGAIAYIPISFMWANDEAEESPAIDAKKLGIEYVSYSFGWMSVVCLSFFLIPVSRHSVLLAAMGWSPVHALRIHIWAGYTSFVFMLVHGVILVPVWFIYYDYPVWQQIVPKRECWTMSWTDDTADSIQPACSYVFANWTGIVAAFFFIGLWGSSINWVRRRNYRLFYICHIVFGTLTILGTILHMYWVSLILLPSITYYLATTSPTLVQALASRFRGGVTVRRVRHVPDSGGCVEVQLEAHETAAAELNREPCRFVKICVPQLSFIWHPFDVYTKTTQSNGESSSTVRFLFRPVGRFTRELAERLSMRDKPMTFLVDGFYRGADKCEQAFQHDSVTLVAGGVAISPFLSLLPAMFRRLQTCCEIPSSERTKIIVLHWVCREPGLCTFVTENYLKPILEDAAKSCLAERHDFAMKVHVYVTGSGKKSPGPVLLDTKAATAESPMRKNEATDVTEELGNESSVSDFYNLSGKEAASDNESGSSHELTSVVTDGRGHPFELARMLPGRYSSWLWNIPYFLGFSASTWLVYWFVFSQQSHNAYSYFDLSKMTWTVIYVVLMYAAFGFVVEATVLGLRKYWPQPRAETCGTSAPCDGEAPSLEDDKTSTLGINPTEDASAVVQITPESSKEKLIVYHDLRPTADQILEDARQASSPGIFMFGPTSLTDMVKNEASRENSYLGLTRFCLYEEPYEM